MAHTHSTVSVRVLDKEYRIACPPGSENDLMHAAAILDKQMRKMRANNHVMGIERMAVMSAINATYKLSKKPNSTQLSDHAQSRLDAVNERIADVLADDNLAWCMREENEL